MNTLIGTDVAAAIGDNKAALRGLWADVAQAQANGIDYQLIGAYVRPDVFAIRRLPVVILKRTHDQNDFQGGVIKYWRVMGPNGHANYLSDLSIEGMRYWGIIR